MEFVEKLKVKEIFISEKLINELKEYHFKGRIDFSDNPMFLYDIKNKIVVSPIITKNDGEDENRIILNGKLLEIEEIKNIAVEDPLKLSRAYNLQNFFDDNKDAKCIIFYCPNEHTVFHEGNILRAFVDND